MPAPGQRCWRYVLWGRCELPAQQWRRRHIHRWTKWKGLTNGYTYKRSVLRTTAASSLRCWSIVNLRWRITATSWHVWATCRFEKPIVLGTILRRSNRRPSTSRHSLGLVDVVLCGPKYRYMISSSSRRCKCSKREVLGLKSVRAFSNVSKTNSEAGSWVANFEPFLPGLLTLSSFSDFPLLVSSLEKKMEWVGGYTTTPSK